MAYKVIHETFWTDPRIKSLPPKVKLLFIYLITNPHTHYSGIYYLPEETIAVETGLTKKEVRYGIDTLSKGYLVRFDRVFQVVWVVNMLKYQAYGSKQIKGIANYLATLHNCPLIKDFLEYYKDLKIPYRYPTDTLSEGYQGGIPTEYRNQNTEINNNISLSKERESKTKPPVEEFFNLWNETVKDTPIPQARELTPQRRDKIRVRLQERPLDQWKEIFKRITASRFCRGDNPRGWRASFDWIIAKQENAVKVLEGKYDDTGIRDIRENSKFTPCGGIKGGKNKYDGVAITAGKDP